MIQHVKHTARDIHMMYTE